MALVGARNASAASCRFARGLAQDLAAQNVPVASGLARGIDTAAHIGALDGGTIGVIASGIDIAFPPENARLQEEVATRGLLIAEQPPGTQPLARHFPRATASSPGWRKGRWWSRPHRVPARSSPRGWRARRGARSWRCPATPPIRARKDATC